MDNNFSHDLDEWLNTVSNGYEVERTIRTSPEQTTEVVYKAASEGQRIGPFIRKRFARETGLGVTYHLILNAQTTGNALSHQPFVYDFTTTHDTVDVVMEYLHGKTLREHVEQEGPGLTLLESVGPALCDALTELHECFEQPIIHRDVKPSNVMLATNRLLLIDLGIARAFHEDATRDTVQYGTPGYAPPEQYGFGQTSVASDVYALGMTLSYCLTGEDPTQQLRESGFDDPRIPESVRPILVTATQFDPVSRYESARALKDDLLAALADPNDAPHTTPQKQNVFSLALGMLWNLVVVGVWSLFLSAAFDSGFLHPKDSLAETSVGSRVVIYLCFFAIPLTSLAYILLDKRLLRRHSFFARFTWRQEVPTLLIATLAGCILGIILYILIYSLFH